MTGHQDRESNRVAWRWRNVRVAVAEYEREAKKSWRYRWTGNARPLFSGVAPEVSETCDFCEKPFEPQSRSLRPVRDHNHSTGDFRGWVHSYCNVSLIGPHTKETAEAVLRYLARTSAEAEARKEQAKK